MIKLTPRLDTIAKSVKENTRVADIGTDHAMIPIWLVENKITDFIIASDVSKGPLKSAEKNLKINNISSENVVLRAGNGLSILNKNDQIDSVIISGMGGELIKNILNRSPFAIENFILQPNNEERVVRNWLDNNSYKITNELIVSEKNGAHYYEIIIAKFIPNHLPELSENDIDFGTNFLRKDDLLKKKYQRIFEKDKQIINSIENLPNNKSKIDLLKKNMMRIEKEILS